jgi:lipopolysaccharide biosynthesis glycosyltransferase
MIVLLLFYTVAFFCRLSFSDSKDQPLFDLRSHACSVAIGLNVSPDYCYHAFVTLFSLLRFFQPTSVLLACYIFLNTLNLSEEIAMQWKCVQGIVDSVKITFIEFNESIASDLLSVSMFRRLSRIPFAVAYRLYFAEVLTEDFIISMDTDMYAGRYFLPELMNIITSDRSNSLIYAVHDQWAEHKYRPSFNVTLSRYINGGFFVLRNVPEGRDLMRLARALLIQNIHMAPLFEQDALNMALHVHPSRLYLLPGHFNCHYGWCWDRRLAGQAVHHRKGAAVFQNIRLLYNRLCLAR